MHVFVEFMKRVPLKKSRRNASLFFLHSTIFLSLVLLFCFMAWSDFEVFGGREINVHMGDMLTRFS